MPQMHNVKIIAAETYYKDRNNMFNQIIQSLTATVKKAFDYKGRASRCEFWTYAIAAWVVNLAMLIVIAIFSAIAEVLGMILAAPCAVIMIAMLVVGISLSVRRLHDVGLSGFWLLYLSPYGLPVVYVAYLLGLDSTCDKLIEKNNKIGSCWLGWILTILAWAVGASAVLFLIFLYPGKAEANEFGENPCSAK